MCVVLHTYGGHPYSDTKALLDYGFDHFQKVSVEDLDEDMEYSRISDGAYVLLSEKADVEKLDREIVLHEDGTDDATVTYFYDEIPVGTCEVTVSANYYNNKKKVQEEPKEIKEEENEPKEDAREEKKDDKERYKAAAAIGAAAILAVCAGIAVITTRINRKREEKRRRH